MAYPVELVAPFGYAVNFRAQELRQHKVPNRFSYGAATDAAAATLQADLVAAVASQVTSNVKRIGAHNILLTHPTGTLYTLIALTKTATGATYKVGTRNWKVANPSDYAAALFTGVASADLAIVALSAAPLNPLSGEAITVVVATVVNRT